jgi:hypothetical protein
MRCGTGVDVANAEDGGLSMVGMAGSSARPAAAANVAPTEPLRFASSRCVHDETTTRPSPPQPALIVVSGELGFGELVSGG